MFRIRIPYKKEEVNHIKFYNNNDKVQHKEADQRKSFNPFI